MQKWAVLLLVGALAACSSSQDANKKNYEKAINQYLIQSDFCVALAPMTDDSQQFSISDRYGSDYVRIVSRDAKGQEINEQALKQMAILEDNGIYKKESEQNFSAKGSSDKTMQMSIFKLTEVGVKHFKRSLNGPLLCVGKEKVKQIDWFTEPTTADGMIVSKVVYEPEYKLNKFAQKLIKNGQIDLEEQIAEGQKNRTMLVLTNEGWKDHRMLSLN